jgi:hypothetical protein
MSMVTVLYNYKMFLKGTIQRVSIRPSENLIIPSRSVKLASELIRHFSEPSFFYPHNVAAVLIPSGGSQLIRNVEKEQI